MSHCDDFINRLYDEDSRRALEKGARPPADMRPHVSECPPCADLWAQNRSDLEWLALDPSEEPPPGLEPRVLEAMRKTLPTRPQPLIDFAAPTLWAISGAALAGCFVLLPGSMLPSAWQPIVVLSVASAAFAVELTLQGLDAATA